MADNPAKKAKANPRLQGLPDWALNPDKYQYKKGANLKPTDKRTPSTMDLMTKGSEGYFEDRKKKAIKQTVVHTWKLPWQ